jgi:hypothetical protein
MRKNDRMGHGMQVYGQNRLPIERVGVPGEASLELKGTILVFHKRTWATSSSMFIPVEWVQIWDGTRRDLRRAWQGTIALLAAVLLALPFSLAALYGPPRGILDFAVHGGLAVLLALTLAIAAFSLARFARPRGITTIAVEGRHYTFNIVFWRTPGRHPELDALLERLRTMSGHARGADHPIRMNHMWHRPRPCRLALLKGAAVSVVLYVVFLVIETLNLLDAAFVLPRAVYGFLAAPPLFYLASAVLRRGGASRHDPPAYRAAVRQYSRGALEEALDILRGLLAIEPDYDAGRLLMIQVCTERYAFDDAFRHCAELARRHPQIATHLQANIWGIKRMYERMRQDP